MATTSRQGEMPLGLLQALQRSPPSWSSRTKVSAVGQGISCIGDNIPKEFRIGVQCLYLSRNRIADLTGIQQFTNLRALSLASNEITTFEALLPLKELFHLEMAILCGNPIVDLPFYRSHVISMLGQSLKRLDGQVVLPVEHETALEACEMESKVLDLAMSSACLLHTARMALMPQMQVVEATTLQSNNLTRDNRDFAETYLPPPIEEACAAAARWMMCQNTEEEESMRHEALYTIRRQASHCYLRTLRTPASSKGDAESPDTKQSSRCLMGWMRAYGEVILTYVSAIEAMFLSNQTYKMVGEDDSRLKSCDDELQQWTKTIAALKDMACEMGRPGVSSSAETDAAAGTDVLSSPERCHAAAVDVLVQRSMALHSELLQYLDGNVAGQSEDWEIPAVTCCQHVDMNNNAADMSSNLSDPSPLKFQIQDSPQQLQQTLDQLTIEVEEERIATELLQRELSGQHELASALEHWLRQAQERAERAEEKAKALQAAAAMWEGQVELVGKYLESSMEEADCKLAALQQEIDELKAVENSHSDKVNLTIRVVSFENEYLQEQQLRRNLEAALKDMEARLSSFSERLECERHAENEYMQKVMLHWKHVAQREHRLHQFCCILREVHNKRLGRLLCTSWQIATNRSNRLNAVSTSIHRRLIYTTFQNWKAFVIASGIQRRLKGAAVSFSTTSLLKRSLAGWKERVAVELQDRRRFIEETLCDRRKKRTLVAWYNIVRTLRERKRLKSKSFSELVLASLACQRGLLSKAFEAWERRTLQGALHRQATSQLHRTRTKALMLKAFSGWQLVQKDRTRQLVSDARQRAMKAEGALSALQQRFDQVLEDGETYKQKLECAIEDRDAMEMQLKRANDRERQLLAAKASVEKEAALERARLTNDLAAARRQILECQHQLVESHVQRGEEGCHADATSGTASVTEARVPERVLNAARAVMGNDVDLEFRNAFSSSLTHRYSLK